ncbi:hypothetical protein ACNKHK_01130 [Shigella flexneri]
MQRSPLHQLMQQNGGIQPAGEGDQKRSRSEAKRVSQRECHDGHLQWHCPARYGLTPQ